MKKFFGFCLVFLLFGAAHGFSQIGQALGLTQNTTTYRCLFLQSSPINAKTAPNQASTVQFVSVQNITNGLYIQINYSNGVMESLTFTNPRTNRGDNITYFYDVSYINSQPVSGYGGLASLNDRGEFNGLYVVSRPISFNETMGFHWFGEHLIILNIERLERR